MVAQPRFQASYLLPEKVVRNRPTHAMLAEIFEAHRSDIPGDLNFFFIDEVDRWIVRWCLSPLKPNFLSEIL